MLPGGRALATILVPPLLFLGITVLAHVAADAPFAAITRDPMFTANADP